MPNLAVSCNHRHLKQNSEIHLARSSNPLNPSFHGPSRNRSIPREQEYWVCNGELQALGVSCGTVASSISYFGLGGVYSDRHETRLSSFKASWYSLNIRNNE